MNFLMHYLPSLAIQANAHYSFGAQTMLYKDFAGGSQIIVGLDTEYTDGWYNENQYLPSFTLGKSVYPQGLHYDMNVQAKTAAPYIHSEWQLLDHTRLTAGIRAEETAYAYSNEASTGIFGLFQRPPDRSDDFLTVTPKLGLVQELTRSWSGYINLSEGRTRPAGHRSLRIAEQAGGRPGQGRERRIRRDRHTRHGGRHLLRPGRLLE